MITAISPSLLCTDVWKHVFYMSDTEAESESSICETWCKMWFSLQRQNETLRKLFSVVENATHSLHATLESDHRCAKSATFLISYNIYLLLLLSIVARLPQFFFLVCSFIVILFGCDVSIYSFLHVFIIKSIKVLFFYSYITIFCCVICAFGCVSLFLMVKMGKIQKQRSRV